MYKPDTDETKALKLFADHYGKNWKDKLALAWGNGQDVYEPMGAQLRALRNHPKFSFDGLSKFKFD